MTDSRWSPSTAARPVCWCRICTSGRALSGCAGWTCWMTMSPDSGKATAITFMGPMAGTAVRGRLTWQLATVTSVHRETDSVATIGLEVPDWQGHRAGQHLDVRLTDEDGYSAERSYSIAAADDDPLAITVER